MKKTLLIIIGLIISFCLGYFFNSFINRIDRSVEITSKDTIHKAIEGVTGIGGVFFKCKDPKKIRKWYNEHLGLNTDEYGALFEWQEGCDSNRKGSIQWSPFSEDTKYMEPSAKEFMINYRVGDIKFLVDKLKKDGVKILDTIETYEYGKFIHIMDIEGNKIELWEPDYSYNKKKK